MPRINPLEEPPDELVALSKWLGLEVMHLRALSLSILERRSSAAVALLSSRLRQALVRRVVHEFPDNSWSQFVRLRPGSIRRLAAALNDLREAGIPAHTLEQAAGSNPRNRDLTVLYRSYGDMLQTGVSAGQTWTAAGRSV